jgi:protein CpxP
MRDQMKKDREAADAELKKVLTEEQYKTYKANEEKRMKEWQQRGRQGGGHPQR